MLEAERPLKIQKRVCEDRISSLSDDLLLQILLLLPTKEAVATTLLSKRWRYVWTMLPRLDYKETDSDRKSVWWLLDQSMRLYDAPILESLCIELGSQCPVDVDVVNWVAKAVDCCVRNIIFKLRWESERIRMPKTLYTCKTLVRLVLCGKIIVDVPSPVSLPSLEKLELLRVAYKDEESHVRLLSGCPVLTHLDVLRCAGRDRSGKDRYGGDNVRKFSVKVPSLLNFKYTFWQVNEEETNWSLVIDTPALKFLCILYLWGSSSFSTEYMPHLVHASISVKFYPDDNLLRSLASINYLQLFLNDPMVPWWNAVNYSRLIECRIRCFDPDECESLVVLLSNCPQLKVFMVESMSKTDRLENHVPVLWNQPSSVPKCLSSRLEWFRWTGYAGREDEKELIRYIVEHSKCLKKAEVYLNFSCDPEEKQKMAEELKSMPKMLTSVLKPDPPAHWDW
ncbi:unnamed protein product [Microthlaspi erraticum]|uniref:FBD domain-containing protein n=1 Tax=Microthlaspi erraticum TaxID=1685480 RepID=A0A6D2KUD6_9BRAS|nr:unnamed protein product [Microthlaspi erraticum]